MTPVEFKAAREDLHLSQRALGELWGVSRNTIQNWETGVTNPPKISSYVFEGLRRAEAQRLLAAR